MKIFIDPGHGGDSIGASYKGRIEQDDTYALSKKVEEILLNRSIEVVLSRKENENPSLNKRAADANSIKADYFLSIHRNAISPNTADGAEIWCYSKIKVGGDTYNKAETILQSLCNSTGFRNRGVRLGAPSYADFGVNRLTNMHSALIEVGFIDSDKDNKIFDEKFEAMAKGIADGILKAFNIKEEVLLGDVDGDGKVTSNDARKILRASVGLEDVPLKKGDMNADGKITASDARDVLRKSVNLNNKEE